MSWEWFKEFHGLYGKFWLWRCHMEDKIHRKFKFKACLDEFLHSKTLNYWMQQAHIENSNWKPTWMTLLYINLKSKLPWINFFSIKKKIQIKAFLNPFFLRTIFYSFKTEPNADLSSNNEKLSQSLLKSIFF